MSEEKIQQQPDRNTVGNQKGVTLQPVRRRLLRSTVAIPVIMTLHSGAVLARTSNMIGEVHTAEEAATVDGQIVCVYPESAAEFRQGPPYDLGEVPQITHMGTPSDMSASPGLDTSPSIGAPSDLEKQAMACKDSGGILVSAAAFDSFRDRAEAGGLPFISRDQDYSNM